MKYVSETKSKISYTTFCRLRPFWVLFPTESDRQTCVCKTCDNTQLMASALEKAGATDTNNLEDIIHDIACDVKNKECMYGECKGCQSMAFKKENYTEELQWFQWRIKTEKRSIKTDKGPVVKDVTFTVKESMTGTISDLADSFEEQIKRYKKHVYNIRAQYRYFRKAKEMLDESTVVVHVDFSENYVCKMATEVQGMHFGASKKQISLHTGVYYVGNIDKGKTFCTVSDNLQHGPAGIWAHMKPILKDIRVNHPQVSKIAVFSDGPTGQYRQKSNFYLFSTELQKLGFSHSSWNFFESGHGKGVPDAVGGALKRNADRKVKYGQDVSSAKVFVESMKDSDTDCRLVTEDQIIEEQIKLQKVSLKTIKGTMKLHQVITVSPGAVLYRDISCHCEEKTECPGHELKEFIFNEEPKKSLNNRKIQECAKTVKCESEYSEMPNGQEIDYKTCLKELKSCQSFKKLKEKCDDISRHLKGFEIDPESVDIIGYNLDEDDDAFEVLPEDIPDDRDLYPCQVKADGNCFPSCASVYAYGTIDRTAEMRVRIVTELVVNEESYLNDRNLKQGLNKEDEHKDLPKLYAQYSDMFVPGTSLNDVMIKRIFRKEILSVRVDKAFMGIWQMHALSNVLAVPIYTIYPELENKNVRKDLNRLILPGVKKPFTNPVYILWTSTRSDMTKANWLPNHFVPVLPLAYQNETCKKRMHANEKENENMREQETYKETMKQQEIYMEVGDENTKGQDTANETIEEQEIGKEYVDIQETENVKREQEIGKENNEKQEMGRESMEEEEIGIKNVEKQQETIRDNMSKLETGKENMGEQGTGNEKIGKQEPGNESEKQEKAVVNMEEEEAGLKNSDDEEETYENTGECEPEIENMENQKIGMENIEKQGTCDDNIGKQEPKKENIEKQEADEENMEAQLTGKDQIDAKETGEENMEEHETREVNTEKQETGNVNMEKYETRQKNMDEQETGEYNLDEWETGKNNIEEQETGEDNVEDWKIGTEKMEEQETGEDTEDERETGKECMDKQETGEDNMEEEETGTENMEQHESGKDVTEEQDTDEGNMEEQETDKGQMDMLRTEKENMEEQQTSKKNVEKNMCETMKENMEELETGKENTEEQDTGNVNIEEQDSDENMEQQDSWKNIPSPTLCVGKHVVVEYDNRPYPGFVEDAGEQDLYVSCMHQVGKRNRNCFFWPKKIKDKCWYDYDSILAIIPEPQKIEGTSSHFEIKDEIWQTVNSKEI